MSVAAIPAITGAVGLVSQINAQKSAQKNADRQLGGQEAITARQLQAFDQLQPFLKSLQGGASGLVGSLADSGAMAYRDAQQYDPAAETAAATSAYDAAARESLQREVNSAAIPTSMRGFLGRNSETGGAVNSLLSRRAADRAGFVGSLKAGEQTRRTQARSAGQDALMKAFAALDPTGRNNTGALQGPSAAAGQNAAMYQSRADSIDPTTNVMALTSGLKKWMGSKYKG